MTYCVVIQSGLWAFCLLLAGLTGAVLLGIGVCAFFERRGARRERTAQTAKRKVYVSGATRVGPRRPLPATPAANDPLHRS